MKRCFVYILLIAFLASCAAQTPAPSTEPKEPKRDVIYLDDLEKQKALRSDQRDENERIREELKKKKAILTRIEVEDKAERKKLIKKQEDIAQKSAQLEKEIEAKIGLQSEALRNNKDVQKLLSMDLTEEEFEKRLREQTDLSEEETKKVVEHYKLQKMIKSAQTGEDLERILKERTDLKDEEIAKLVEAKKQILEKQKELRHETLKKIYDRLVRNRRLNIDAVFCSQTSKLDQLVLTPVYYPFDVHVVSKKSSTVLFNDYNMIASELSKYPDMIIQLEGNCDYKGSNRYNKALGDRRWSGVEPYLVTLGYPKKNIKGVSKGEECQTPKNEGESDDEWRAENRRTDFVWTLK